MLEVLFIAKILVTIGAVVGLSLVAEHVSPRIAGILSGYPLGCAIALFFIGVEQSPEFAAEAAIHTLTGFTASLVFTWAYYAVAVRLKKGHLVVSAVAAMLGFLAASALLKQFSLGLLGGSLLTVAAIVFFVNVFSQIKNLPIKQRATFTRRVLIFRAAIAALTIWLITSSAAWFGPVWAGLLSAFPITFFPLMLIIHLTYGKSLVFTLIKNFPLGLGALICYVLTVSQTYTSLGLMWGTLMAFAVSTLYLIALSLFLNRNKK